MPGKWFEAGAGQVGSVRESPIDETTKAKCGREDRREEFSKGAGHVGVCDGLPQAGSLTDGGDQLDGGALQVVLDGGDDDRDDHDDQLDGGAHQGHRCPGQ